MRAGRPDGRLRSACGATTGAALVSLPWFHRPNFRPAFSGGTEMRAFSMVAILTAAVVFPAAAAEIDWKRVDEAMGRPSAAQAGGVHRFGFPRSDLKVVLDGVEIKPALAL